MRAFCVSLVFAVLLAVIGALGLDYLQESSSAAYSSASGARLDQGEAVNDYARGVSG
jgi:hypothetical protein